ANPSVFVAELLATTGRVVWSRLVTDDMVNPVARDVEVAANNRIWIVGDAEGSGGVNSSRCSGTRCVFLLAVESNGDLGTSFMFPGTNRQLRGHAVAPLPDENVALAVTFFDDFDPDQTLSTSGVSDSDIGVVIANNDRETSGVGLGDILEQRARAVVEVEGQVVIGGENLGGVDFAGSTQTATGASDALLLGYSGSDLLEVWGASLGDEAGRQAVTSLEVSGGRLVAGGTMTGGIGGLMSAGETDLFFLGIDRTGAVEWRTRLGTAGDDQLVAMDVSGSRLAVLGISDGTLFLRTGTLP
ncbi:MAG: hypothetical protein AAGA56_22035, partial [Myxococcota bacterium]